MPGDDWSAIHGLVIWITRPAYQGTMHGPNLGTAHPPYWGIP
jgi:hypothetical protein